MILSAAAAKDAVSLLEQVNTFPGNWNEAISSNLLEKKKLPEQFLSAVRASNTPSQLYLRAILTPAQSSL